MQHDGLQVNMNLPYPWLLGVAGIAVAGWIALYYRVDSIVTRLDNMAQTLEDTRTSQKATNADVATMTVDVARLDWRVTRVEAK